MEIKKKKMIDAARQYMAFLESCPEEREEMQRWAQSDLERPRQKKKRS